MFLHVSCQSWNTKATLAQSVCSLHSESPWSHPSAWTAKLTNMSSCHHHWGQRASAHSYSGQQKLNTETHYMVGGWLCGVKTTYNRLYSSFTNQLKFQGNMPSHRLSRFFDLKHILFQDVKNVQTTNHSLGVMFLYFSHTLTATPAAPWAVLHPSWYAVSCLMMWLNVSPLACSLALYTT